MKSCFLSSFFPVMKPGTYLHFKSPALWLILAALTAAVLFRLGLFVVALHCLPPSSDEAWPALMGFHILQGEFPIFYWGQAYMGAQEAYFDALLIPWLGFNIMTVRLYPLLFSCLFLLVTYWLARTIYNPTVGLIALVLLAIPMPYLAMSGALIPPPEYLALTTLGSLALILLARMVFRAPQGPTPGSMLLLGFILGFIFWLHLVALSYIGVALLFLFFKDKWILFRRAFWIGVIGFAAGSLPLWIYNLTHDFETFTSVGRTVDWAQSFELLQHAFRGTLQYLVGMKVMLYGDNPNSISLPPVIAATLGAVWIGALLLVIVLRFKSLLRLALLSVKDPGSAGSPCAASGTLRPGESDGTGILLVLMAATLFLFCRSERSGWWSARYLFPVLSALPVLMAFALSRIREWSRPVFVALLTFIIGCQLWGNLLLVQAWSDPEVVGHTLELPATGALHHFLKAHGIRHAYAHYWLSYRLTFESQEDLICSEPYNERFPGRDVQYIDQVRAATNAAYITHPRLRFTQANFATLLQRIGGRYRQQTIGCFTVFYDFKPPYGQLCLREIPRDDWVIATEWNPRDIGKAMDGDTATIWESQCPQTAGMGITVDLGRTVTVCNVRFDLGRNVTDYPRGYQLETSLDGRRWTYIGAIGDVGINLFWEGNQPWFFVQGDHYNAAFPPVKARWVKVTLKPDGPPTRWWWALAEIRMFGPDR